MRKVLSLLSGVVLLSLTPAGAVASAAPGYRLIDVGTFGGPQAGLAGPAVQITSQGAILGAAETTVADSDFPNFNPFTVPDPFLHHAFAWQDGKLTDLGALPGNNSSAVFEMN